MLDGLMDSFPITEEDKKKAARKRKRDKATAANARYRLARAMNGIISVNVLIPAKNKDKFKKAAELARNAHLEELRGKGDLLAPSTLKEWEEEDRRDKGSLLDQLPDHNAVVEPENGMYFPCLERTAVEMGMTEAEAQAAEAACVRTMKELEGI